MGLFSSKPAPNTISDKDWKNIQDRALKANPKLRDSFSAESVASSKAGAKQFKNRHQN